MKIPTWIYAPLLLTAVLGAAFACSEGTEIHYVKIAVTEADTLRCLQPATLADCEEQITSTGEIEIICEVGSLEGDTASVGGGGP